MTPPTADLNHHPPKRQATRVKRWLRVSLAAALLAFALVAAAAVYLGYYKALPGEEKVPAGHARNTSSYVAMQDGTRLAADVWVPADLGAGERLPTIMMTTRYWRAHDMGPAFRLLVALGDSQVPNLMEANRWNEAGYVLVLVDARGSGASSGNRPVEWSDAEVADLGEVTEWITSQPWSDGTVGATGASYVGNTAEFSTISAHPALKAVAPLYSDFDPQFFLSMPGGVYNRVFVEAWNSGNQALDANDICTLEDVAGFECWWLKLAVPGVKPVDDDSDGSVLRDAVAGHATLDLATALETMSYRDDAPSDGGTIGEISPYGRLQAIEDAGVPMLVRAGWLDAATADGALSRYMTSDMGQELVIGAWNHGGLDDVDPFQERWTFPNPGVDQQFVDLVGFFDRHLTARPEAAQTRSVRYYTMNEGVWRTTSAWPPTEMEPRRWFLGDDNTLTNSPPLKAGEETYSVEASASSGDTTRWHTQLTGGDVYYPDRADQDAHLLVYTSAPLEADMRITGTPKVTLQLASTHADGAVHVYLEDLAPDGRVTYITEGILRLIHGVSDPALLPYELPGPPRSFLREDAKPLRPGELRQVELPLFATSVRLQTGHRLRIAIAGQDTSTFARYPGVETPIVTVIHSPANPSLLELPVAAD